MESRVLFDTLFCLCGCHVPTLADRQPRRGNDLAAILRTVLRVAVCVCALCGPVCDGVRVAFRRGQPANVSPESGYGAGHLALDAESEFIKKHLAVHQAIQTNMGRAGEK